jgi:hypothetical protein
MSKKDTDWLVKLSQEDSVFRKQNTIYTYQSLAEVRERLETKNKLTNNQMVDGMTFGF